jgi:hypothetical protein
MNTEDDIKFVQQTVAERQVIVETLRLNKKTG